MDALMKVVELKRKALRAEIAVLETELALEDPDPIKVDDQMPIIVSLASEVFEALQRVIDGHLNAGDEANYLDQVARLQKYKRELATVKRNAATFLDSVAPQLSPVTGGVDTHKFNLPQMKLPEFSGNVREWLGFWSSFSVIDSNNAISNAEKFQYLLQCLKPSSDARRLISSYPVCDANYAPAVDALKKHYGRPKMLVKVYVLDLLQLVIHNANEKTRVNVMDLVPQLSSQIRNLSQLGVTSDKCEEILYPVVESCLPEDVLQAWQRSSAFEEKLDPLMTFLREEVSNTMDRALARVNFNAAPVSLSQPPQPRKKDRNREQNGGIPAAAAFMVTDGGAGEKSKQNKQKQKCDFCERSHETHACGKAKTQMTLEQRLAVVKEKNLCYTCLQSGHTSTKCKAFVRCSICTGKHYEMLCKGSQKKDSPPQQEQTSSSMMIVHPPPPPPTYQPGSGIEPFYQSTNQYAPQAYPATAAVPQQYQRQASSNSPTSQTPASFHPGVQMTNITLRKRCTLFTMLIAVKTPTNRLTVRLFLDEGSDDSFITGDLAKFAKCPVLGRRTLQHQIFGGRVTQPEEREVYQVTLQDMTGIQTATFEMNSVPRIAHNIQKPQTGPWIDQLARVGIRLHDQTTAPDEIHILIGLDIAAQILTGRFYRINQHFIAKETIFGWVVGGRQEGNATSYVSQSHMLTTTMLQNLVPEDMWNLEILGITDEPRHQTKKDLEEAAIQHFEQTVKRLPDGRYEVELPWIEGHREVQSNRAQATAQLHRITKELKEHGHLENYSKIFSKWQEDGIIEEAHGTESEAGCYYMPHKHVVKASSTTTPLRPVFNASAKAKGSVSLNECLEKGPNFLEEIPAINMRFRKFEVGVISDIEKAFLQMSVAVKHRNFLRFLWWTDATCKSIQTLRHQRVVFGVSPSPFLLGATLKHHITKEGISDPELSRMLLLSMYVDNSVSSHPTLEDALAFQDFSEKLLLPAKFNLRGWEYSQSKEEKIVPVLGLDWNTKSDTLQLHLDSTKEKLLGPMTKRGLSMVNSVFDPMGLACPFTLTSKLLYQECCVRKLGFDDPLPTDIAQKLEKWKQQVPVLEKLRIPRWASNNNDGSRISIHSFSDGSQLAYSTSVYIRSENGNNVEVQLVYAKARVAPTKKKLTIPRMELMGCLISARLTNTVLEALDYKHIPVTYWSDSTTALAWIKNDKPWGRFVLNRVEEIRRLSTPEQWRHIPGEHNPADLPSRGCTAERLIELNWHQGPTWLRQEEKFWPASTHSVDSEAVQEELKKTVVSAAIIEKDVDLDVSLQRISDYHKILRVVVMMNRYLQRLKHRVQERKTGRKLPKPRRSRDKIPVCSVEEIEEAEKAVLLLIQKSVFSGSGDKRLSGLNAFTDSAGLIRIKSQLFFGHDDFNIRCPVVLPDNHTLVKSLIRKEHEVNTHAGVQTLQSILRNKFWILKSRRVISNTIRACVVCRRFVARKCEPVGVPLPLDRIRDTVCFDVTGVDLAGPLFLPHGEKVWIVLYTDAVYRGVHLELTTTLSTEGFLRTFRRFVARRGRPRTVYSDNGLNFVGCNNLFRSVDWSQVQRYASVERIHWKFNPPTAAWWGGFWERIVGLMKTLLRRILGKRVVHYDELQTILCDVESTLNHRPLTFISDGDGELLPICPAYHMKDIPHSEVPEADAVDSRSLKRSVRKSQQLREELRSRFRKEYLAMLRINAGGKGTKIKPRDVVLIGSDDSKRIDWPFGIVEEVYPGRDGRIRTALVKTKDGKFLRAVQRLYLLEVSQDNEKVDQDAPVKE